MKRNNFFLAIIASSLLVAGVTAFTVTKLSVPDSGARESVPIEFLNTGGVGTHFTAWSRDGYPDLTYAAENAVKAVVNIENIQERQSRQRSYNPLQEFFGIPDSYYSQPQTREVRSGGSGVIISPDGYIVTNNHVIENSSKLKVKLHDNRTFNATLIGTDPGTDVALIKIDANDLPTLPFGDSDELRLGEWVLAIGSPFDLQSTVTAGIVSAKARNLSSINDRMDIQSFIQTDAAVNMGNSGGALVNTRGQLVGINTALTSPTGTFTGYSFAVPVSIVQKIVIDLKEYGVVQRAMIGIGYHEINDAFVEELGEEYSISQPGGLYIASVEPGGGADRAGVRKGDIITAINGHNIESSATLLEEVARHRPNDHINLTVKRDGMVKQFDVILRNKAGKAELLSSDYVDGSEVLGGTFAQVSPKMAGDLGIDGGVLVTSVKDGGILSKARVKRNYIITEINERPIGSVSDLSKIESEIISIDGVYPDGRRASYSLIQ